MTWIIAAIFTGALVVGLVARSQRGSPLFKSALGCWLCASIPFILGPYAMLLFAMWIGAYDPWRDDGISDTTVNSLFDRFLSHFGAVVVLSVLLGLLALLEYLYSRKLGRPLGEDD